MKNKTLIYFLALCIFGVGSVFSQETKAFDEIYLVDSINFSDEIISKSPTKAALYSAILPGLGQLYNKKTIKAPIVWAVLGAGIGFIAYYQGEYQDYRSAFISELNGEPHQFSSLGLSAASLGQTQVDLKRFRDYAIVITSLVYFLNILDAAVDAHLFDARNDRDLKITSSVLEDTKGAQNTLIGFSYRF